MERAKKNHGTTTESVEGGTKIMTSYGKDNSDVTGSAKDERMGGMSFKGGITNLSHSLSGTSANQKGS